MTETEKYYDEVVVPALAQLCKDAHARGCSFYAAVEYGPGDVGHTSYLQHGASYAMDLIFLAARANGNVDQLMASLAHHAKKHGHSSLVMKRLGIPEEPENQSNPN